MDLQNIQRFVLITAFWIQRQNLYSYLIPENKPTVRNFRAVTPLLLRSTYHSFFLIFSRTLFWYVTNMRHQKKLLPGKIHEAVSQKSEFEFTFFILFSFCQFNRIKNTTGE